MSVSVVLMVTMGFLNECRAAEKKLVMDFWYDVKAGDSFLVTGVVRVAESAAAAKALGKAIDAKDRKGEDQMMADGKVERLPAGSTLRVVSVVRPLKLAERLTKLPTKETYAECRFERKDKTTGKGYILLSEFNPLEMRASPLN
jgi:hypothetical protein